MTEKKNKKAVTSKTRGAKKTTSKSSQPLSAKTSTSKKVVKKKATVNKTTSIASLKNDSKVVVAVKTKKEKDASGKVLSFMYDFAQALVIASLILLLTVSFFVVGQQKESASNNKSSNKNYFSALDETKIVKKGKGFFGSLIFSQADASARQLAGMGSSESASLASGDGITASMSIDSKMIIAPYPSQYYNYVYTGEDFALFPEEVDVYKRMDPDFSGELASSLSNKKISFFDIGKFKNISVNNLTINEEKEYGYSIYLGLKDGSFSIYKNWDKWPSLDKLCGGYNQACYDNNRFKIENVLADDEIISIANGFLQNYNINLEGYNAPEVQKYWMRDYEMSVDKSSYYISETINVIYPLKINGMTVHSDFGQKVGVNVEVDMREKKVSGIYNMYYQYYEGATYDAEVDRETILKTASQGGIYPEYYYMGNSSDEVKKIDIELGTPSLGLVKTWQYDQATQKGYELHVPAYIFPIKSRPEGVYFSRDNIVVPAVKDFFSNYTNGLMRDIKPMLQEAVESSASSIAPVEAVIR